MIAQDKSVSVIALSVVDLVSVVDPRSSQLV